MKEEKMKNQNATGNETQPGLAGEPVFEKGTGIACRLYGYEGGFMTALFKSSWSGTIVEGIYNPTERVGHIGSLYSGGMTGFGVHPNEIKTMEELKEEGYELITYNLSEIEKYFREKEAERKREEEERKRRIRSEIERMKMLPKEYILHDDGNIRVTLTRHEPYTVGRRKVQCYTSVKINDKRIFLDGYITKDGKILTKKFYRDCESVEGIEKVNLKEVAKKYREIRKELGW